MAMTDEAYVKKRLKAFFNANANYWYMPTTGGYGRSGAPDFLPVIKDGRVWGIECKGRGRNKTTHLQRLELEKLYRAGVSVAVVDRDNIDAFEEMFQHVSDQVDFRRLDDYPE